MPKNPDPVTPPLQDSPAHVRSALSEIRDFYNRGAASLKARPYFMPRDEPERRRLSPDLLRAVRRVATRYTPKEFKEVCALALKHRFALGLNYLVRLQTINSKDDRRKFQREAIENHWSSRKLNTEIRKRFGKRRCAGRYRKAPENLGDAYYQLDQFCENWRGLSAVLGIGDSIGKGAPAMDVRLLPVSVRARLMKIDEEMGKLADYVAKRLEEESRGTREWRRNGFRVGGQ